MSLTTATPSPDPKPAHAFQSYLLETFCKNAEALKNKKHRTSLHTALIVKRGKVIAEATNQIGSRSMGSGFSDHTIHAEKAVIKKLGDFSKLRGADLYVFRVGGEEHSHFSQPCKDCQIFLKKCMREYGLRFVFYSI
jgi:hypothetical protein